MSDAAKVREATPSTPTFDLPSGPLTFYQNRALIATRNAVPGSLRVALVGDSMTYGAGLPFKHSLASRVGVHLNGALPEVWVECLMFGSPGACAYDAVGRVISHVLPLEPDIIVLCLCCNDAIMLASEPESVEAMLTPAARNGNPERGSDGEARTTIRRAGCPALRQAGCPPLR